MTDEFGEKLRQMETILRLAESQCLAALNLQHQIIAACEPSNFMYQNTERQLAQIRALAQGSIALLGHGEDVR